MYVQDLAGNQYHAMATYKRTKRVNGERDISLSFFYDEIVNRQFIEDLDKRWIINVQGDDYVVIFHQKKSKGNKFYLEVRAVSSFHTNMKAKRKYDTYENKSFTAVNYFNDVFQGTQYTPVIVDSFNALQFSDTQRGKTCLERFNTGLNRFSAEYYVQGNLVYIQRLIGVDSNFMYAFEFNLKTSSVEIDSTGFATHAKGFGKDGLTAEYTSPLADIYGIIEAEPIDDENYTIKANLENALKELVDNSVHLSVQVEVADMREQGYDQPQPNEGDRIWLIDKRINFKQRVRIVELVEVFDFEDNIIDQSVTLGSLRLSERYKAQINNAIRDLDKIFQGKLQLPYNVLDDAVKLATQLLLSAHTELEFNNGIIAVDKNNPNLLVLLNSNGLGVSVDGGQTFEQAITSAGVNTNLLTAGTIHTNNIRIVGSESYFYWDGNELIAISPSDTDKYVKLTPGHIEIGKGAITIYGEDGRVVMVNGIPRYNTAVQNHLPDVISSEIVVEQGWYRTFSTSYVDVANFVVEHNARYLHVNVGINVLSVASGAVWAGIFGYDGWTFSSEVFTTTEAGGQFKSMIIDLGVPTYESVNFTVRLRVSNDQIKGGLRIGARVLRG
ncbi:phage tail protein [Psychrobacillus sp.]|uniref:phage tail protein n=1 Tax=Psychrobacillus sp. TaxID=1871623 RepID=UPI0028BDA7EC|nr:phage tail protein [Psychrobacillus sp.]